MTGFAVAGLLMMGAAVRATCPVREAAWSKRVLWNTRCSHRSM